MQQRQKIFGNRLSSLVVVLVGYTRTDTIILIYFYYNRYSIYLEFIILAPGFFSFQFFLFVSTIFHKFKELFLFLLVVLLVLISIVLVLYMPVMFIAVNNFLFLWLIILLSMYARQS